MRKYVTQARLILDIHTENFDSLDLLSLTFPIKYEQLAGAKDGRTATLVRKLNVTKFDMLNGVLKNLCISENEIVSKGGVVGKITQDQAIEAKGMMRRDVSLASRERSGSKRFKHGNTADDAIQLDDVEE